MTQYIYTERRNTASFAEKKNTDSFAEPSHFFCSMDLATYFWWCLI